MLYLITAAFALLVWVTYCRSQRYKRVNKLKLEYGEMKEDQMSMETAQKIFQTTIRLELPWIVERGLEFALFATYSIPTISSLLAKTGFLLDDTAGSRAEQTAIIFEEFLTWDVNDKRTAMAIARMNFLHAQYGSKILNDDLLYTLATAVYWPVEFARRYGWREFEQCEKVAIFKIWQSIGQRMGIKGIPASYEDLVTWMHEYDETHQVYAASNTRVADSTLDLLLEKVPAFVRPYGRKLVYSIMPPRMQVAFGYTDHPAYARFAEAVFKVSNVVIHYMKAPRNTPSLRLRPMANDKGRYHPTRWAYRPLYVPNDWSNWLWGVLIGHKPGPQYQCEGYKIEEIGPEKLKNVGHAEVFAQAEEFLKCPFH